MHAPTNLPVAQLYNTRLDPLEQRNVVGEQPELYDELLTLLLAHVRNVEQRNPAIAGARNRQRNPRDPAMAVHVVHGRRFVRQRAKWSHRPV